MPTEKKALTIEMVQGELELLALLVILTNSGYRQYFKRLNRKDLLKEVSSEHPLCKIQEEVYSFAKENAAEIIERSNAIEDAFRPLATKLNSKSHGDYTGEACPSRYTVLMIAATKPFLTNLSGV